MTVSCFKKKFFLGGCLSVLLLFSLLMGGAGGCGDGSGDTTGGGSGGSEGGGSSGGDDTGDSSDSGGGSSTPSYDGVWSMDVTIPNGNGCDGNIHDYTDTTNVSVSGGSFYVSGTANATATGPVNGVDGTTCMLFYWVRDGTISSAGDLSASVDHVYANTTVAGTCGSVSCSASGSNGISIGMEKSGE